MAESTTPRLGLSVYDSGNDLHPNREKFNTQQRLLEAILATARKGPLSARPAPGDGLGLYWATDSSKLYFDDGIAWRDVNTTGGGGAGGPIAVGGTAGEGQSARAARADHTHALPLASGSAPGAMSAADKAKLDGATEGVPNNALVKGNANGQVTVNSPTSTAHAVNLAYLNAQLEGKTPTGHKHTADDVDSGVFAPARLPLASGSAPGAMSAADKAKLDAATSSAVVADTLVRRTAGGHIQGQVFYSEAAQSSSSTALTRKDYVDAKTWDGSAITKGTIDQARIANATSNLNGLMSSADKAKLDAASMTSAPATLMMRDNNGNANVASPTASGHVANKGYVDAQRAFAVDAISTGEDLNTYTTPGDFHQSNNVAAAAGSNYPAALAGLLEVRVSGSFIYQRYTCYSTNGASYWRGKYGSVWSTWAQVADTTTATSALDGLMAKADKAKLDSTTPSATPNSIPYRNASGLFNVAPPVYADNATTKAYVDAAASNASNLSSGTVNPDRIANATSALDGLMAKADKAKLDKATSAPTANTLVMNDANGRFQTASPAAAADVANKSYVDTAASNASNLTSGTVAPARLPVATQSVHGAMSAADKKKLDSAAYNGGPNSIPMVNASGYLKADHFFADETSAQATQAHALTRKSYVDAQDAKQVSIAGSLASGSINGVVTTGEYYQSSAAQVIVSNGYPYNGSSGTLKVMQYAGGMGTYVVQHWLSASDARSFFRSTGDGGTTWRPWVEIASTDYADNAASDASNLTKGTVNPARIANATSALDGLMSKADKAKLDAATVYKTASTIPLRNANGCIEVGDPTNNNQATNKGYVDGYDVLWSGGLYMDEGQVATLSQKVTSQKNGVILVWSAYVDGAPSNSSFVYTYVPKYHITSAGSGMSCILGQGSGATSAIIVKYVYVEDTQIKGADGNKTGVGANRVLRAVLSY